MRELLRELVCWWTHSRYGDWNVYGDIVCTRCDRIVWKGAAYTKDYERTWGTLP